MRKGEVREISDLAIIKDLLKAGYIVEVGSKPKKEAEPKAETKKETKKK
jgi:hypothetical protein